LRTYGFLGKIENSANVVLTNPLNYLDSIFLVKNSNIVLTDSGGIQKEAYMLGTPCITLREDTEWVETVEDGWNILVGAVKEKIINSITSIKPVKSRKNYYGRGDASKKIVEIISHYMENNNG